MDAHSIVPILVRSNAKNGLPATTKPLQARILTRLVQIYIARDATELILGVEGARASLGVRSIDKALEARWRSGRSRGARKEANTSLDAHLWTTPSGRCGVELHTRSNTTPRCSSAGTQPRSLDTETLPLSPARSRGPATADRPDATPPHSSPRFITKPYGDGLRSWAGPARHARKPGEMRKHMSTRD